MRVTKLSHWLHVAAIAALAVALPGCGGAGTVAVGSATSSVEVNLLEWAIGATTASVPSGRVTFDATNQGPDWRHELVILRTDLAIDAVPTKPGGSVDEAGEGVEVIGEIAGIPPSATGSVTLDLAPGTYMLICNLIEDIRVHYDLGMRSPFEVTS